MTTIRLIREEDWPGTWAVLEPLFRTGETYSIEVDITEEDARGPFRHPTLGYVDALVMYKLLAEPGTDASR